MASSLYDTVRANVDETGADSRVEVNQRALIDKILARYASTGAVYRELLQNSNDAEATKGEIHFSTKDGVVTQVLYRNNGMPFRPQDWSRLKKIAEGNPDESKIGAFGVGFYSVFSICEEPLVISGKEALAFFWKGDALWTKVAANRTEESTWTSFVMPSRDTYPLPNLVEFGEFLCSSLTFTKSLRELRVFVDEAERLSILKSLIQEPRLVSTPKASSWFTNDGAVTSSPKGTFSLNNKSIYESIYQITVDLEGEVSSTEARYVSALANTKIGSDMTKRMERVTKKNPPKTVNVEIFLNAKELNKPQNRAEQITNSFAPKPGAGRIFIGFRTSQTTGLAAHLAAPFVPTVEREAMDLQEPTLKIFNTELLEFAGILMRLSLDHAFALIDVSWQEGRLEREELEKKLRQDALKNAEVKTKVTNDDESIASESGTSGIVSFARFMARGVKKTIVSAVNSVEQMVDRGGDFMNPPDPRPLSDEERQAILLMQSFCPQQSTPDPAVGTALAQGFSRCMPNVAPPVLTRSGVIRGDVAKLPHRGIEGFVRENVVRKIVYSNAQEYFTYIACSRQLNLDDLLEYLKTTVLEQKDVLRLLNWWTRYSRVDSYSSTMSKSFLLKESIRFFPNGIRKSSDNEEVACMSSFLFFVEKDSRLSGTLLPLPDTVLPIDFQNAIGLSVLTDSALSPWFSPLPIDIWLEFIAHDDIMNAARPEDEHKRIEVLVTLNREFDKKSAQDRAAFGDLCRLNLANRKCIPFDSDGTCSATVPGDLYVFSAELEAFEGMGSFYKASELLKAAGVSEIFLLTLGVRKSVSIDFLFSNLETLKWTTDPKPLVEYLRTATLSKNDLAKLVRSKYLPAENDTKAYAPSELYLPSVDFRLFPFVRMLSWPSESEVSPRSENGKFLVSLGMKTVVPLSQILTHLSLANDQDARKTILEYLCERLGPNALYYDEYTRMSATQKNQYKILPCVLNCMLESDSEIFEFRSPVSCYSTASCSVMGFPIINPALGDSAKVYGSLFQCPPEPSTAVLLEQLLHLVDKAKEKLKHATATSLDDIADRIERTFHATFLYLSHRTSDFTSAELNKLRQHSFIPVFGLQEVIVQWYSCDQVFFPTSEDSSDELTKELFPVLKSFNPFLAAVGVKPEATTADIFYKKMLVEPQQLLNTLGSEKKYRLLLRRVAANPPFSQVSTHIRNAPFLLAYTLKYDHESTNVEAERGTYHLAKAKDVYIIDNSFFGRMFSVPRAPPETDLEEFYCMLGSNFISKSVDRRFEVVGKPLEDTDLTIALKERVLERAPLLVSPSITSRPLVTDAVHFLKATNLEFFEAKNLLAVYTLDGISRRSQTTCFSRKVRPKMGTRKNAIFVVENFDWFDVGYAIGDLILERCQLEDAFFISSLLEAPLDQLQARGFPVDRVLNAQKMEPSPQIEPVVSTESAAPPLIEPSEAARIPIDDSKGAVSTNDNGNAGQPGPREGYEDILKQMFPDADESFVREKLGSKPSLDNVRRLAEEMATGRYPKAKSTEDDVTVASSLTPTVEKDSLTSKKNKGIFRRKLGRAFNGLRGSSFGGLHTPHVGTAFDHPSTNENTTMKTETRKNIPPVVDAQSQDNLERMLERSVGASRSVDQNGVETQNTVQSSIPEGLDRGSTCETVSGQSLKPFLGSAGGGRTKNGMVVFSQRDEPSSETFLSENLESLEAFSLVIEKLAGVYSLDKNSMAIYHDPHGTTIAFNRNRAIHFNIRYFHALHYLQRKQSSQECYAYWFTVIAHELAHHFVSAHNKEHGFYTESYIMHYLPKLASLLSEL